MLISNILRNCTDSDFYHIIFTWDLRARFKCVIRTVFHIADLIFYRVYIRVMNKGALRITRNSARYGVTQRL